MKVMNYVYATGVYILINAALYGSEYSKAGAIQGPLRLQHLGHTSVSDSPGERTISLSRTQQFSGGKHM